MKIRTKMYVAISIATTVLAALLIASGLYFFGRYSRATEREHGLMAAELVRTELLMHLMAGTFDEGDLLPELQVVIPALQSVRISRTEAVVQQFGGAGDLPATEAEREVLSTREPTDMMIDDGHAVYYRYVAPYIAESAPGHNCLGCHNVPVGTPLGAVVLELDLTRQRTAAVNYTSAIVGLMLLFAFPMAYVLHRLFLPIVDATDDLHDVVSKAEKGDFSGRLEHRGSDEIGRISEQTNRLMATLEESFGTIVKDVEMLSGHYHVSNDRNQLTHTVATVRSMAEAVRFRQTIESDRDPEEIYQRLRRVLEQTFHLERFALYEVDPERDNMRVVFSEGLPDGTTLWCRDDILIDAAACRVRRTVQPVNSLFEPDICAAFCGEPVAPDLDLSHICLPLLLGGRVGGVLQIVYTADEAASINAKLHTIKSYIEEAAPVIESKRLTQILRESTLKDALTGLYNRRFLDQFLDRIISAAERREESIALVMCDLDSFKLLNDSHGHQAGDLALREAVRVIGASVRHSDYVIRMGGDEFLAILVDSTPDKAVEAAERIRTSMAANRFEVDSRTRTLTLSLGVSVYPVDSDDFEQCVRAADIALYAAKAAGCNRVVRFTREMLERSMESGDDLCQSPPS